MAPTKQRAPRVSRNPDLIRGIGKFSKSQMYHKKGIWAIKAKNGGVFPRHDPKPKPETAVEKPPKFYPADDVKKPLRNKHKPKQTKLRASITPGTVLILLAGRFKGKRVVFLKQLPSGLLLVTGPFKINGVPLRRVNQAYVIGTSTKVDISGVNVDNLDDKYFSKEAPKKKSKGEGEFFESDKEEKKAKKSKVAPNFYVMETWFIVLVTLCIIFLIRAILSFFTTTVPLPPGPLHIPIITNFQLLQKSISQLEPFLKTLHAKHGPIITVHIGSRPSIFINDHALAHHVLVQNSAIFSDRPTALPTSKMLSSNQHNINTAFYGPTWRTLRRNLASEMLHPSKLKSFSEIRKWVLRTLINRLKTASESEPTDSIKVMPHFKYAMFSLLVFMCFGERVNNEKISDIERVQRNIMLNFGRFNKLNFWPKVTRILLRNQWEEFLKLLTDQEDVLLPLIRARKQVKESKLNNVNSVVSYADTLLDLEWPEEKRKLSENEMVNLCSEFLNGGTDTTSTSLQWIMANVVKYPEVQGRLVEEIREVMGGDENGEKEEVKEEVLQKLRYLKCVVLEGLRRHPPGKFPLPHAVKEDVVLNGYLVPKNGTVNFLLAEMGLDPRVWEDPLEFKPERFLKDGETFDITCSKEIKMMPFGAGRRICPGLNLALLHLEYFVANLVWNFDWKVPEGGHVDLTEIQEFTMVMKNPLQVRISPRI